MSIICPLTINADHWIGCKAGIRPPVGMTINIFSWFQISYMGCLVYSSVKIFPFMSHNKCWPLYELQGWYRTYCRCYNHLRCLLFSGFQMRNMGCLVYSSVIIFPFMSHNKYWPLNELQGLCRFDNQNISLFSYFLN